MPRRFKPFVTMLGCALLAAAGCQVEVTPPKPSAARGSERPASAAPGSAAPATRATPGPAATATPAPTATKVPVVPLVRPAGEVVAIKGTVALDASYMVAAGAGNVLSHNGGAIVAAGGLNLIGLDGGSLIGMDGGSLVGNAGNTIVAAGGLNMVAAGAGNIVADKGSGMVAAGAGNLVAAGAGNYALLQASPAPLAVGTVLPAAVVRLGLVDLRTGKPLVIGKTPGGDDVTAVYTDIAGGFAIWVPRALQDNVRMVVQHPVKEDDPRLQYQLLVDPITGVAALTEDTAVITELLRTVFVERMRDFITKKPEQLIAELQAPGTPGSEAPPDGRYAAVLMPELKKFADLSARKGLNDLPPAEQTRLAQLAADTLLTACDFEKAVCDHPGQKYRTGEQAIPAYVEAMREIRATIAERMAKGPLAVPELAAARDAEGRPYEIKRPSDFTRFLVRHFLTSNKFQAGIGPSAELRRVEEVTAMLDRNGLLADKDRAGRMQAAGYAIVDHMFKVYFGLEGRGVDAGDGTRGAVGEAVVGVFRALPDKPGAAASPTPAP